MACFLVPATEAVVTTVAEKIVRSKETKDNNAEAAADCPKVHFSTKLSWLNKMLWGGSALLAFEHVWHGEIVPWFPFLTAMSNAEDAAEMFHEIATVGVSMAGLITVVWLGMCAAATAIVNRKSSEEGVVQ